MNPWRWWERFYVAVYDRFGVVGGSVVLALLAGVLGLAPRTLYYVMGWAW